MFFALFCQIFFFLIFILCQIAHFYFCFQIERCSVTKEVDKGEVTSERKIMKLLFWHQCFIVSRMKSSDADKNNVRFTIFLQSMAI